MSKIPKTGGVRAADVGADGVTLYTRTQAARWLGVDVGQVRAACGRGALSGHCIRGVWVYPRAELERYRATTGHGKTAAAAFRALREGASVAGLVEKLEIAPDVAERCAADYARLTGAIVCQAPAGTSAAWARAFGTELSPAVVLDAVERHLATPRRGPSGSSR